MAGVVLSRRRLSDPRRLYHGDPAHPCAAGDPQICNNHGTDFEIDDDPLLMVEGAYSYAIGGQLPGTIKVGGWNHFGEFEDNRVDVGGELVVISGNSGKPLDNDWALYVIMDQLLWRVPAVSYTHLRAHETD